MAGRELVLLSSGIENPQDLQIAVSAVHYFVQSRSAAALSCLAKSSIEVLLEARKTLEVASSLYPAWSPQNTDELIWEYQVQRVEDAECWCQELSLGFINLQETADIETEDQYKERIKQAVQDLPTGCHLAIVPGCVVATVLEVCGVVVELPVVCLLLKLGERGTECTWFANTYERLQKLLLSPLEESSSAAIIPTFVPKQVEKDPPVADSMQETRLKQVEDHITRLTSALDAKSQEIEVCKETFKLQNAHFEAFEARILALQAAVSALKPDSQANAQHEDRWENWDLRFQQLDSTVQELRGSVEALQHTTQVLASPGQREKNSDFPVNIEKVEGREGKWYASLVAVRPCWGNLGISHGDSQVTCPQPYHFSVTPLEIDLSALFPLQPGQLYQLYVLCEARKASNDFSIRIQGNLRFEDTYFCQSCANVTDLLEHIRRISGETAVQLFKRLACEWANPQMELLEQFVSIFMESGAEETAVRLKMGESGFKFS